MLFVKDELKHLGPFYLATFIYTFSAMILPFMVIYFLDIGLNYLQILLLFAASQLAGVLFEIPTGVYADTKSRKKSVLIGYMLYGLMFSLLPLLDSFTLLLILWGIVGLANTFVSGAYESWAVSNIKKTRNKKLQKEFFIKEQSIGMFGFVLAPLVGGVIVNFSSIRTLWFVLGIGILFSGCILWLLAPELNPPQRSRMSFRTALAYSIQQTKKGFQIVFSKKITRTLLVGGVFVGLLLTAYDGWTPYLVDLGLPVAGLGFVTSAVAAVFMIIPLVTRSLWKKSMRKVMIWTTTLTLLAQLAILFVFPPYISLGILCFFLTDMGVNLGRPLIDSYWHNHIPEKLRATAISVKEMTRTLILFIPTLIVGRLMDVFSAQLLLGITALFGIFAIATFRRLPHEAAEK